MQELSAENKKSSLPKLPQSVDIQLTLSQKQILDGLMERFREIFRESQEDHPSYIDNIICLLGERGVGKTTVLYKLLKEEISKDQELCDNFIITRPIDPEMIDGDIECVLFWVFLRIEEKIKKLITRVDANKFNICKKNYFDTIDEDRVRENIYKIEDNLKSIKHTLALISGKYREKAIDLSYSVTDFAGHILQIQKSGLILQEQIRYFFEDLFSLYEKLNKNSQDIKEHKLILIPFDDIDMAGPKTARLLHILHTYLRHDRVIILLLGAWSAFRRSVYSELMYKLPNILREQESFTNYYLKLSYDVLQKYIRHENIFELRTSSLTICKDKELQATFLFQVINIFGSSVIESDYYRLFQGNLRYQLGLKHWFAKVKYIFEQESSSQEEILILINELVRLLEYNSSSFDFRTLINKYFWIEPIKNDQQTEIVINIDYIRLTRDKEKFSSDSLVLSICFIDDLLQWLKTKISLKIESQIRELPESDKKIALCFFKKYWCWLDYSDMPVRLRNNIRYKIGRLLPWWSHVSFLSERMLLYLNILKRYESHNFVRHIDYLMSNSSTLSNDILAHLLIRFLMLCCTLDMIADSGDKIVGFQLVASLFNLQKLDVCIKNSLTDSSRSILKEVFDMEWQLGLLELLLLVKRESCQSSPLINIKEKLLMYINQLQEFLLIGEPDEKKKLELLNEFQKNVFHPKWIIWGYYHDYITKFDNAWKITNAGIEELALLKRRFLRRQKRRL